MRRRAKEDTDLFGKHIRKDDKVVMWYVPGNRDDEVIDDPMGFRVDREHARHHLSFSFGIHRCMGNRLAEMQLRVAWEEIMKRFHTVEVMADPVRVKSNIIRGYRACRCRFTRSRTVVRLQGAHCSAKHGMLPPEMFDCLSWSESVRLVFDRPRLVCPVAAFPANEPTMVRVPGFRKSARLNKTLPCTSGASCAGRSVVARRPFFADL